MNEIALGSRAAVALLGVLAVLLLLLGWRYRQVARERDEALALAERRAAEARAFHRHLHPHFFFNALAGLRGLIRENPEQARLVVTRLAAILRGCLRSSGLPVPLAEEIRLAEDYLYVEKTRFEDRLHWEIACPDGCRSHLVPAHAIRLLIRNAVTLGIEPSRQGGRIRLACEDAPGGLRLNVRHPVALDETPDLNGPEALALRQDLQAAFGPSAALDLRQGSDFLDVTVFIPSQDPSSSSS